MPYLYKTIRKDMEKKSSGKLSSAKRHNLRLTSIFVIFPCKTHRVIIEGLDSGIADRYTVSIAPQILYYMSRRFKRFLTKYNPIPRIQMIKRAWKLLFIVSERASLKKQSSPFNRRSLKNKETCL